MKFVRFRNWLDDIHLLLCTNRSLAERFQFWLQVGRCKWMARLGATRNYWMGRYWLSALDPVDMPALYQEVFLSEPYYFRTRNKPAYIIDCGANIGVSLAYFKWRFPNGRILALEPHPGAFKALEENVQRNQLSKVTLVHAALTGSGETAELTMLEGESMASTLTHRLEKREGNRKKVQVKACRLSQYLVEPVDFLKMDIEGVEAEVLLEAGEKLRMVQSMFIEVHLTQGQPPNNLTQILDLLDQLGFCYLLNSTLGNRRHAYVRPYNKCGPVSSVSLYARRIEKDEDANGLGSPA